MDHLQQKDCRALIMSRKLSPTIRGTQRTTAKLDYDAIFNWRDGDIRCRKSRSSPLNSHLNSIPDNI
ncbi:hypothetical protein PENTCL1PPCAC_1607 [Pristionchus entomophagus]|uniref:Uncharacterized protein n=1 Tax=Pristionchus entomophagus TaxID=358040 RepID=A0AAV5SA50_9BILA|nr:hypothetical protein PENTCL1PPCAC_1607 [Pristionchus entomophagus]